jgi:hypothetical protein
MKKIYLILVLLITSCLFFTNAQAQQKTGDWSIDVGPTAALPIRNLYYFTSFGIGADAAATTAISDNINVGGRVNFAHFFGKTSFFGDGVAISENIVNVLADGSYMFPQKVFVGVDLGAGIRFAGGGNGTDTEFARIFNLGYQWDQSKQHTYIFTIFFDQTTYQKNLGLRAAIRLK